jgi:hypothetical protein
MIVVNGEQARVSQRAPCRYEVAPTSQNIGAAGGAGTPVTVSAPSTCQWGAASNAAWITITSGASGTGSGTVRYLVAPNVGGARTGTLTIAGQTFTVTQAALACSYSISPNRFDVGAQAGTGAISVSASSGCAWTATSNDSWITVTSGASGTGTGTVTFSYTANGGNRDRRGTITVAGRTATIDQEEPD